MKSLIRVLFLAVGFIVFSPIGSAATVSPHWPSTVAGVEDQYAVFPRPLNQYDDRNEEASARTLGEKLKARAEAEPFNISATIIFVCAILHTFAAGLFQSWSHRVEERYQAKRKLTAQAADPEKPSDGTPAKPGSFTAKLLHVLGEVEIIFALWAVPLLAFAWGFHGWQNVDYFVTRDCRFTEPLFVIVIMAISATRPVLNVAEQCLSLVARRLGGGPAGWWLSVLTIAPLLGSLITEPAAMTISAMLLARKFYELRPRKVFAYATLGLLFVNISVGGVLTNFAAPPVLMVAAKWGWSSWFMLSSFGWHAVAAIICCNAVYFLAFHREFKNLRDPINQTVDGDIPRYWPERSEPVPPWIVLTHLVFLAWTVYMAHFPMLFGAGFIVFAGFVYATRRHQHPLSLRGPVLVGLFLAGLVLHGRCQGWWLGPVLNQRLEAWELMLGATVLTGFNDNALITFLASQVPGLSDSLKFAVMAGAVAGGGLTVIANAPNPAGQGILKSYFGGSVSPVGLFLAALVPTAIVVAAFMVL